MTFPFFSIMDVEESEDTDYFGGTDDSENQVLIILLQAGLMAAHYRQFTQAFKILEGVEAYRPTDDVPTTSRGMAYMYMKRWDDAIRVFRDEALTKNPDNHFAKVLMSMSLQAEKKSAQAESLLNEVLVADDADDDVLELAQSVLNERVEYAE